MTSWSGRLHRVERRAAGDPLGEGPTLLPIVRSLAEDRLAWLAVVVRREHIDLLDPRPFARNPGAVARFLAGLTRSVTDDGGPALAVGLAGNLQVRVRALPAERVGVPVAVAFLEAPDCDWWLWQRFLGAAPDDDAEPEQLLLAQRGDPLPNGLGRWWSLGRRTGVKVSLSSVEQVTPTVSSSPLVH